MPLDKTNTPGDKANKIRCFPLNLACKKNYYDKHGKTLEWKCFLIRNEHKDMLSSFGLAEHSNFPTAAFVPAKSDNKVIDAKIIFVYVVKMFCA